VSSPFFVPRDTFDDFVTHFFLHSFQCSLLLTLHLSVSRTFRSSLLAFVDVRGLSMVYCPVFPFFHLNLFCYQVPFSKRVVTQPPPPVATARPVHFAFKNRPSPQNPPATSPIPKGRFIRWKISRPPPLARLGVYSDLLLLRFLDRFIRPRFPFFFFSHRFPRELAHLEEW